MTERANAGWQLRDVTIDDTEKGTMLSVTWASGAVATGGEKAGTSTAGSAPASHQPDRQAWRYSLGFSTDGRQVTAYREELVAAPRQARIYGMEKELIRFLATASPTVLEYECGTYFLGAFDEGLAIDPLNYHVVTERSTGKAAAPALARLLTEALDRGLDLVAVQEAEKAARGQRIIDFSFAGQASRIIRVSTDRGGRVLAVEVQHVPHLSAWQTYTRSDELAAALTAQPTVRRVTLAETDADEDEPAVVLDGRVTIRASDFEAGDFECPC